MKTPEASYYEVLSLQPRATREQIEKAYEFFRDMYDENGLATYSLLEADELEAARARIREAYEVLCDPVRRHQYDVELGAAPRDEPLLPFEAPAPAVDQPPPAKPPPAVPRPAAQVLPAPVRGDDLRRLREERGISLRDIAAASKVGVRYLEYIEADRHTYLPARVYLRGFLMEYARALGLDPLRTAKGYLEHIGRQKQG